MNNTFEENIDIYQFPEMMNPPINNNSEITIGDLHGNTLTLICLLTRHGIIKNMTKNNYDTLKRIYLKSEWALTKKDITEFKKIIAELEFNTTCLIRLIGDELADRGNNDIFTIILLEKLSAAQVPFEILLSNHGFCFISYFSRLGYNILKDQITSLVNLHSLMKRSLITQDDVESFRNKTYLPHLKLLSYTIDTSTQTMSIYSHAPVGLENIRQIAQYLKIKYRDSNLDELKETIDNINQQGSTKIIIDMISLKKKDNPIYFLMWNRNHQLERPVTHHEYHLQFVHGHVTTPKNEKRAHIVCLDGELGQYKELNHATYTVSIQGSTHHIDYIIDNIKNFSCQIQKKAESLPDSPLKLAADRLNTKLNKAINEYKNSQDWNKFKINCKAAIDTEKPVLEKHRGFKDILAGLMLCLTVVGVPFVVYKWLYQQNKKHLFFKTHSHQLLDEIQEKIFPKKP